MPRPREIEWDCKVLLVMGNGGLSKLLRWLGIHPNPGRYIRIKVRPLLFKLKVNTV